MRGFAVEIQLIEWQCRCEKHIDGICRDPKDKKRETHRTSYRGDFGWNAKTRNEAFKKWDQWMGRLNETDN